MYIKFEAIEYYIPRRYLFLPNVRGGEDIHLRTLLLLILLPILTSRLPTISRVIFVN
jgi:hypothetical protein